MTREGEDASQPESASDTSPSDEKPTTVGIGASAGGLAALKKLFADIPDDSGLAWVVVMHLSPNHESHLADLLHQIRCQTSVELLSRISSSFVRKQHSP